jgi:hypothetical protein
LQFEPVRARGIPHFSRFGLSKYRVVAKGGSGSSGLYADTRYRVGHPDHIKAFVDPEAAERWFKANDPEDVAFRARRKRSELRAQLDRTCDVDPALY